MDTLILLVFLAPLLLLVLFLVRHARRIHREMIDKDLRTQQLEDLDRSLVQTVLDRDQHTCRTCGGTARVGVDFHGDTPGEEAEITPDDLEARCADCYLDRWQRLRDDPSTSE